VRQEAIRERCFHPSGTFVPFPRAEIEASVVARFGRQVGRYPDRLAVKAPGRQLTYAELDAAANRVANALLVRRGRGAEPIALLVPKTAALVVGVLGVLKAGKIYVLLDPAQPSARLGHVLRDCGAGLVLADASCLAMAAELAASASAPTTSLTCSTRPAPPAPRRGSRRAIATCCTTS
jgi:non-ribosomal peptide synthetase component F